MTQITFPPSEVHSAHRKPIINAIDTWPLSCVLALNDYLAAPVSGESIDDAVRLTLLGIKDSSGNVTECSIQITFMGTLLFSQSLPNSTAGLVVRTEGKAKTKSLVGVDRNGATVVVVCPRGSYFTLNPTGEAVMIEKSGKKMRHTWSSIWPGHNPSLFSSIPNKSKAWSVPVPLTTIDILAWQHFVREYNAGRCPTVERIKTVVEAEINRLGELRAKGRVSSIDNGHGLQAAWFVFNKLREYRHVSGPFVTEGKPPPNGGVFLDIASLEQNDQFYTESRFPLGSVSAKLRSETAGCPGAPLNITGITSAFSRNCAGKDCLVPCLAPNPMTCRDPTPGGLGQGMPLGFEGTDRNSGLRCRMLVNGDATPSQVLAAVNCGSADPTHACMGQSGSNKKPRISNTAELDTYMSSYCTKMVEYAPGDAANDCPVDPLTGHRPNKCPNALRLGRAGQAGPADACRRWQRGAGAEAAHSAYVALCTKTENRAQPWCDCIAGSLPGARYFRLHEAARSMPFTTRQSEGCWFPPCARNDYTLQRKTDIETDLGTCQVACVNVINVNDSANVNMADVSQQMTCSVGKETISVRSDSTLQPEIGPSPAGPPSSSDNHLIPTPPPNVPDTILPGPVRPVPGPVRPVNPITPVSPPVSPSGEHNANLIFGMERMQFYIAAGAGGVILVSVLVIAYILFSKRGKRS